jgi:hypothetical protein
MKILKGLSSIDYTKKRIFKHNNNIMGLDIYANFVEREELDKNVEYTKYIFDGSLFLSRTFCNFMCRKDVIEGIPELNQIGTISNCDIEFFYKMESYFPTWDLEEMTEGIFDNEEKQKIRKDTQESNQKIIGNIEDVKMKLTSLINALSKIENLPKFLQKPKFDTLNHEIYFSNFNKEEVKTYTENNLGQDLKNLLKHIELAIKCNAKTVYFSYG